MVGENTLEKTRNACEILVVLLEGMRSFRRIVMDMRTILRLFLRDRTWKCAPDWIFSDWQQSVDTAIKIQVHERLEISWLSAGFSKIPFHVVIYCVIIITCLAWQLWRNNSDVCTYFLFHYAKCNALDMHFENDTSTMCLQNIFVVLSQPLKQQKLGDGSSAPLFGGKFWILLWASQNPPFEKVGVCLWLVEG